MYDQAILVISTVPSMDIGKQIANALLEKRLAACINILPSVNSLYTWQGKTADDEEFMLIIKSWERLFSEQLVPAIKLIHPYEIPEIIALPIIMGSEDYLDWMRKVTGE